MLSCVFGAVSGWRGDDGTTSYIFAADFVSDVSFSPHLFPFTPGNKNTSSIQTLELLTYVVIATFATYYTYAHSIAHHLLEVVLARDPTALQQVTLCVGVWLAYVACVLVVFYKSAKLIRR